MIAFFPRREDRQPLDIGRDRDASILSRRRLTSNKHHESHQDGYGGFVQTVNAPMRKTHETTRPEG